MILGLAWPGLLASLLALPGLSGHRIKQRQWWCNYYYTTTSVFFILYLALPEHNVLPSILKREHLPLYFCEICFFPPCRGSRNQNECKLFDLYCTNHCLKHSWTTWTWWTSWNLVGPKTNSREPVRSGPQNYQKDLKEPLFWSRNYY